MFLCVFWKHSESEFYAHLLNVTTVVITTRRLEIFSIAHSNDIRLSVSRRFEQESDTNYVTQIWLLPSTAVQFVDVNKIEVEGLQLINERSDIVINIVQSYWGAITRGGIDRRLKPAKVGGQQLPSPWHLLHARKNVHSVSSGMHVNRSFASWAKPRKIKNKPNIQSTQ